ncbi:PDC sensor domain-containing protein [Helicobacter rodentium]|uniref:PDC sensor domain-containing protein n=2 Tax=Helicobacter rodentium TaxID=59617 RepID=UPI002354E139|nr:PDC sensor domain-containing protein [Helicobacter rodentium]
MLSKDITYFSEMRYEIRAYLCFLMQRNIKNHLPHIELNKIVDGIQKIEKEVGIFELIYVLDSSGTIVLDGISRDSNVECKKGENHNERAYFYRAVREKKCILTDPYPSLASGNLVITVAYPLYDTNGNLAYVVCMDVRLEKSLELVRTTPLFGLSFGIGKAIYFIMALSLLLVCMLLLVKGSISLWDAMLRFGSVEILDIKSVFEATILITLSLAIFDLVRAIFEEEVLGRQKSQDSKVVHQTMTRFLGSIVIALAIESLMLVFKFAITAPEKLLYAVYLIGAVTCLLIGLALYVKLTTHLKRG